LFRFLLGCVWQSKLLNFFAFSLRFLRWRRLVFQKEWHKAAFNVAFDDVAVGVVAAGDMVRVGLLRKQENLVEDEVLDHGRLATCAITTYSNWLLGCHQTFKHEKVSNCVDSRNKHVLKYPFSW
jgi:hypothetical protein